MFYFDFTVSSDDSYLAYLDKVSTEQAVEHPVILNIVNLKSERNQRYTLDGLVGGNIIWSPFKPRMVFQVQDLTKGTSIIYFDLEANLLRYIIRDEQSDFLIDSWSENNLLLIYKTARSDQTRSKWYLNPFTHEILPAPLFTSTP